MIFLLCSFSYYFNGLTAKVSDYIDPSHFETYREDIQLVKALVKNSDTPGLPIWLGEGADSYDRGTANITDRYISGFL